MAVTIEPLRPERIDACIMIMRSLPTWFGIESAIRRYADDLRSLDGFVALDDGEVVGFVGLKRYGDNAVEVNVIAVRRKRHRRGIGSRLLREAEKSAAGAMYLHTKTLSPSKPDAAYAQSRAFWKAEGFVELDEHALWGPENPCLVLVKRLRARRSQT